MTFAAPIFLYWFLPATLAVYLIAARRGPVGRTAWLGLASLVFYGWWRPDYLPLLVGSSAIDYAVGLAIGRATRPAARRGLLLVSVVTNLGLLAWFKYANLGVDTAAALLGDSAPRFVRDWERILLPVGISFYTFQSLSYVVDVYRGTVAPTRSFGGFLTYVALFPQLVAGPIVRYAEVADELEARTHTTGKFATGVLLFQIGFAKKALLADVLAAAADGLFGAGDGGAARALLRPGFVEAWFGALSYSFQLYFDFSGYSDMAIGLGLMFGFRFPRNFLAPYRSASVTEFWRRWHVTLSSFLRDYLYVPLGGNRRGPARAYLNLFVTMLLGGLWHGAQWTFVAWGAYHGLLLAAERAAGGRTPLGRAPRPVRVLATFVAATVGWVLFRAQTFADAGAVLRGMAGLNGAGDGLARLGLGADFAVPPAFVAAVVAVWGVRPSDELATAPTRLNAILIPLAFVAATAQLFFRSYSPFLYYRF